MIAEMPDMERTREFMELVEFSKMMKRVDEYVATLGSPIQEKAEPVFVEQKEKHYSTIDSMEKFDSLLENISNNITAFDTETTSLQSLNCELVGFSFSYQENEGFYLPCNDVFFKENNQLILSKLKAYFEDKSKKKVGQNLKYDCLVLSQYDIKVQGIYFDTMIANHLLHPGARNNSLDDMAKTYFNYDMQSIKELIGTGKKEITMDLVDIELVSFYASEDADITFQLYKLLEPKLHEKELWKVFSEIEIPLLSTLIEIEKNGVHLDTKFLADYSADLEVEITDRLKNIHTICDEAFFLYIPEKTEELQKSFIKKNHSH